MKLQEGTLRVAGANKIEIRLNSQPREVGVEFLDEEIIPCNHHHHHHHHQDKLEWRIAYRVIRRTFWSVEKEFFLEIKWRVENIRTIKWVVIE
jgi:hypothetical protein